MNAPMSVEDVRAAAQRIAGRVVRTPVIRHRALSEAAGAEVWLKAENLQHIGAFKARGAMHAVGRLDETTRARGVVTFSSGNHAQAVALAAKSYGIAATIVMPTDAPKIKVAGVRELGGTVVFSGTTSDERKATALELAEQSGASIVQPFDHPDIIAGAGTATLEFHEQVAALGGEPLDVLLVPVGGGGLIAGACLASQGTDTKIYAVEPYGCDSMAQSLAKGERVAVVPGPTIGDGLKPVTVGALNFEIAKAHVAGSVQVDDAAMGRTLAELLIRAKVLVEPSGAAALSVALDRRVPVPAKRIGVLLSGGNIEPAQLAELVAAHGAGA
ncbi:MAG: threonine/serine dehydratase [Myxococcota bacterium]